MCSSILHIRIIIINMKTPNISILMLIESPPIHIYSYYINERLFWIGACDESTDSVGTVKYMRGNRMAVCMR